MMCQSEERVTGQYLTLDGATAFKGLLDSKPSLSSTSPHVAPL